MYTISQTGHKLLKQLEVSSKLTVDYEELQSIEWTYGFHEVQLSIIVIWNPASSFPDLGDHE